MGVRVVNSVMFERDIGGYLKRAADANTIELAELELAKALSNMEQEGMTSGFTSILWQTPDEDVGFWFKNITSAHRELEVVDFKATQLEKTNILMKLRETLLDQGSESTKVTAPSGISLFPNNILFAVWGYISLLGLILSFILFEQNRW